MKIDFVDQSMNDNLTLEEYLQTRPNSVKEVINTSIRILDTFSKLSYDKTFDQKMHEFIPLDRDTRQDKILSYLGKFSNWCQVDHPEITYKARQRIEYHKKKAPRTIMTYTARIRDVMESVYGVELQVRNLKKKLKIPSPNDFDPKPLSKEEIRLICDYAKKTKQKLHYMVLKDSGMRIGESVAIRKKHIDITKTPVEIYIPAQITKTNRSRTTYITRECRCMLVNHLKNLDDNALVFGNSENQSKATDNAEHAFWRLREELAKTNPRFARVYEENGLHEITLHAMRAFTATQCANAVNDSFGHGIVGHKKYLGQYIRNQDKMPTLYLQAENSLMIYESVQVIDQSSELNDLKEAQIKTNNMIQEIFALQKSTENRANIEDQLKEKLIEAQKALKDFQINLVN